MTEGVEMIAEVTETLLVLERGNESEKLRALQKIAANAEQVGRVERTAILALKGLVLVVVHDPNEKLRQYAWDAVNQIGTAAWQHIQNCDQVFTKQAILDQFIKVMRECSNLRIKLATIDWLAEQLQEITRGCYSYRAYKRVADALDGVKRDARERVDQTKANSTTTGKIKELSEWEDIRERADTTLKSLWEALSVDEYGLQKEAITDREKSENDRITAIWLLSDRTTLGSREALRFMVEKWVEWMRNKEEPRLVEFMSEAIRYNRYTVLALIEHFGREPQGTQSLNRRPAAPAGEYDMDQLKRHVQNWLKQYRIEGLLLSETEIEEAVVFLEKVKADQDYEDETQDLISLVEESRARIAREKLLSVDRRIAKQLADMSDPAFFDDVEQRVKHEYKYILSEVKKHVVPVGLRRLVNDSEDKEIRENLVRMLGYTGGREVVDALARQLVGDEKKRKARQELLDEYYLKPSLKRSDEAATILNDTVKESKKTLRILQTLNIGVFLVGLTLLSLGLYVSMSTTGGASRVVGAISALGGFTGMIALLVRDPLERIQNAMANLVHVETAFTSFIWELNLNGTYIQSVYVKNGKLKDAEIAETGQRIENAMETTMRQVAIHTEASEPRLVTRLTRLDPVAATFPGVVTLYGQNLLGDSAQKAERGGIIAFDHVPLQVKIQSWREGYVRIELPELDQMNGVDLDEGKLMLSLFVDGMETNALPLHILKEPEG